MGLWPCSVRPLLTRTMPYGHVTRPFECRSGHDADVVRRVLHLLDSAEYKRRQAPPGVKLTSRAFGRDRRYPITNRFRYGE